MAPIGVTLGFSNNNFMTNEGTGAPCLICIQLLAGALEKSIHAYVTTGVLGTAQRKFVHTFFIHHAEFLHFHFPYCTITQ